MRRHRVIAVLAAFYMTYAGGAVAADVLMLGKGVGASCGTWSAERKTQTVWLYGGNWVLGFMSGAASALNRDFLDGLDSEAVFAWIDGYCRTHPLARVADAATGLLEERSRK
jgi:hypothetical protein